MIDFSSSAALSDAALDERSREALHALNNDVQAFALVLDYLNQCSIYCFNAWGASDALLDKESNASLIKRLEELSVCADSINDEATAKSKALRAELRPLLRKVKKASEMAEVTKLKAVEEQQAAPQPQATPAAKAIRKTKTQLVAEAKAKLEAKSAVAKKTVKAKAKTAK